MTLRLSALDLSPIPSGATASDALRNTIDLARHVESLGYARYWLAEHHNAGSLASSSPEVLIAAVAAATRTITVGAGGIMLPNHSPLKVAELFRVLHALHPGRIDLGLGRAAGTDPRTAAVLRGGPVTDDFVQRAADLLRYLDDDGPPRAAFASSIRAIPLGVPAPALWILGSSDFGAAFAARNGLGFAFAHHINPSLGAEALRTYRAAFRPSARYSRPHAILAVSVVCADDENAVRDLTTCAEFGMLQFARGRRDAPMPDLSEARAHVWDAEDRALLEAHRGRLLVGTKARVREALCPLIEESQADELMLLSHAHDHAVRKRSYELVAEALLGD